MKYKCAFWSTVLLSSIKASGLQTSILPHFLVLFTKEILMLISLCVRALKYLSICFHLAIGVVYVQCSFEIRKGKSFSQHTSFSFLRFCIFPSATCQFCALLFFSHPTIKTKEYLWRKSIPLHALQASFSAS